MKEFEARWIGWAGVNVPDEVGQKALTKALAEKVPILSASPFSLWKVIVAVVITMSCIPLVSFILKLIACCKRLYFMDLLVLLC